MPSAIQHYLRKRGEIYASASQSAHFAAIDGGYGGYGGASDGPGLASFAEKIAAAIGYGRIQLMPWIDPYTDEKPEHREAYRKMLRHAVVKAALLGKIWSVASLDLSMAPGGESPRAQEMADFALAAFTREITGRLKKLAETIFLTGLIDGHSISEKVWSGDLKERGPWRGRRFFRDLKAKDNVRLKVDEFRNVIAVQSTRGNVEWDPADFVIFRNLAMFEGPGMSDLRAAYGKVWMIDTAEKLRMVHLEKFTSPYFDVTIDDPNEEARTKREIAKATARSWIVHPTSVKIQAMQLASAAPATFTDTIRDLKEDVALSIAGAFLQMLTANAGGTNIRGNSNTQRGTAELFVWALAAELCNIIDTQLTPQLIDENYAPGDDADYPTCSLGGINYADLKSGIEIEQIAQNMGQKLSRKAHAKKYGLQLAATPEDALVSAAVGQPGFGPMFPGLGPIGGGPGGGLGGQQPGQGGGIPEPGAVVDPQGGAAEGGQVQALNGAQIASLLAITDQVAQGILTLEAAKALISAAFPLMDPAAIEGIINNLRSGGQPAVGGPPSGGGFRAAVMGGSGFAEGQADHCGGKGGKPGPCPTGVANRKVAVKIKAAAATVEKINVRVQAATVKLGDLKVRLKAAKVNLRDLKASVVKQVSTRAVVNVAAAKSATRSLDSIKAKLVTAARAGKAPDLATMRSQVAAALGKASPIAVAKEMGFRPRNKAEALGIIDRATVGAAGLVSRTQV